MDNNEPLAAKASWESLQQGALDHYEELATKAHHWSSFIPAAIKAYKDPSEKSTYIDWLDREIGLAISAHDGIRADALIEARKKFLSLYPSQEVDNDEARQFTDGLD